MESFKLVALGFGDPDASPPFRCSDKGCKHLFEERSLSEEGRCPLGAARVLLKESVKQVASSDLVELPLGGSLHGSKDADNSPIGGSRCLFWPFWGAQTDACPRAEPSGPKWTAPWSIL